MVDAGQLHGRRVLGVGASRAGSRCRGRTAACARRRRAPCSGSRRTRRRARRASPGARGAGWSTGRAPLAGRQLHAVDAVGVLDHQLAAVVLVRVGEEQRRRQVGADAVRRAGDLPDGVVDVVAERLPALVAVEERREDAQRQRRGDEQRVALQRRRIRSPSSRATGWSSGSCRLSLARADWWPAVTRPSTQSAASSAWRAAWRPARRVSTSGMCDQHARILRSRSWPSGRRCEARPGCSGRRCC